METHPEQTPAPHVDDCGRAAPSRSDGGDDDGDDDDGDKRKGEGEEEGEVGTQQALEGRVKKDVETVMRSDDKAMQQQHQQQQQQQQEHGDEHCGDEQELSGLELFVLQMGLIARECMAVHLSYEDIKHLALVSRSTLRWYREFMASVHAAWRWHGHSIQAHDATVRSLQYYFSHFHRGKLGTQSCMVLLVPLLRQNKVDCASLVWRYFCAKHKIAHVLPQHVRAMGVDLSRVLPCIRASPEAMRWFREEVRPVLFPTPEAWRERVCAMAHSAALYKELDLLVNICENEPDAQRDLRLSATIAIRAMCQRDRADVLARFHAVFHFTLDDLHPLDIETAFHHGSQGVIDFLVDTLKLPAACRSSPQAWGDYVAAADDDNNSGDSSDSDADEHSVQDEQAVADMERDGQQEQRRQHDQEQGG